MAKVDIVVEVIAEYLRSNRRLVVPAFGAFMVKESGEYLFSNLLSADDGVLASLLRDRGLTEMEAAIVIDRFIFEVRHELEQYGYYRLEGVGILRLEPDTKALRLYPLVEGELPKQTPYIPKQVSETETENGERKTENENKSIGGDNETPATLAMSEKSAKPRKKVDFVMVVAIIILLAALVGIGYGWYVSNLGATDDDAAMDALRVVPEQIVNE